MLKINSSLQNKKDAIETIPKLFIGTLAMGGVKWDGAKDKDSLAVIRYAIENGPAAFDAALQYGKGHAERLLGQVLSDYDRAKIFIATKTAPTAHKYDQVISCCEQSLKNLNTDYIDLLQIHWPSGSFSPQKIPIEETLQAFIDLKNKGIIKRIGVCNFSLAQLKEAKQYAEIDSVQNNYSLLCRDNSDVLRYCQQNNIRFLAYSPLAQGLLSAGENITQRLSRQDMRHKNPLFFPENHQQVQQLINKLTEQAKQQGLPLREFALQWLADQGGVSPIVGVRNLGHASIITFFISVWL
jgi:myo-inositol catabolism protein IolS